MITNIKSCNNNDYDDINLSICYLFQLWDVAQAKCVRVMGGHAARVGSLAWNSFILSR